jgi:hypothetical protein
MTTPTTIEPDAIVRNTINGRTYKVRSVSKTKAVCWPMTKTGKKPASGMRATAVEFKQENLQRLR